MSKKFNYLYTILHYYHQQFLKLLYENKKMSNKIDNSWKIIKLKSSVIPQGWTKENAFKFLEKEYKGKIMKAYKN